MAMSHECSFRSASACATISSMSSGKLRSVPYADPRDLMMLISPHDGRLYHRQGRWRFLAVYGKRCRYCRRGILWIKRVQDRRQVAIEPSSWDGEEWFKLKKHVTHGTRCQGMRDQMMGKFKRKKIDPNIIL